MTEDEAKTKWCPFAFTFGRLSIPRQDGPDVEQHGPQNRGYSMKGPLPGCFCIASACMAWRWDTGFSSYLDEQNGDVRTSSINGHCGLAGRR